jgi:hypothetical protein
MSDRLSRYAKKHPQTELEIFDIPQIPGNRRPSHANKSVAGSLMTTGYAIPIVVLNPYIAGGLFVDYLARGRYQALPKHLPVLTPDQLSELTTSTAAAENPAIAVTKGPAAGHLPQAPVSPQMPVNGLISSGIEENVASHE